MRDSEERICMMITEDKRILVDTNILIYFSFDDSQFNKPANEKLNYYRNKGYELCITTQIIREFLVNVTRLLNDMKTFPTENFEEKTIRFFEQFKLYEENEFTTHQLISNIIKYCLTGKIIHDANIVSVMQSYNIKHILTHNVDDFKRFDDIEILPLI
jgi:predicted nucleic acid-binding protein